MRYTFELDVRLQRQLLDGDTCTALGPVSNWQDDADLLLFTGFGLSKKVS